ncbi:MAG: M20/M25/M40 family metallo-hydrolase [Patescibacteria group bacterium]|jgi:acetylornithine deacetylase/succinyl-diaminopimelate desuccinylase-like protein
MELTKILSKLITIPSFVDEKNNEQKLAVFIESYLKVNAPWLNLSRQYVAEDRWNIIAGEAKNPELVFVCHMDTVQPTGDTQKMLSPSEKDGYIYGLGAADMKGGTAALLAAIKAVGPTKNVAYVFDCDEEYYFKGAKQLLKKCKWNPQLVICPEPTDMEIVNGCRGIIEIKLDVIGKSAHAGRPDFGINAIEKAVAVISELKSKIGEFDEKKLGRTTVNLSRLDGGKLQNGQIITQGNAVPDVARVLLDIRPASNKLNGDRIIRMLMTIAKRNNVTLSGPTVTIDYPAYYSIPNECINRPYRANLGKGGFYEAALFSRAWQCTAFTFGPGDASTSHSPDERVKLADLTSVKKVFEKLLLTYRV